MRAKRASRRAAALLCAAALLVNLISTAWAASAFLRVCSASAAPGETRSVYVSGSNLDKLAGVQGIVSYDDTALDALVRGGVTVLETVGGVTEVLRGVTTRSKTAGAQDATWRELNTILIVDEVIPGLRTALRSRFARCKNNRTTRAAIRARVVMELESRMRREIIDSYDNLTVKAAEDDPPVCLVEVGFTVTHGLSRIYLTAHITV